MVQPIYSYRKGKDYGSQRGATHITTLGKAIILEPRMVQPIQSRRKGNVSGAQWCSTYKFLKKLKILEPGMMQPNEFPKKGNDSGAQTGATHINSVRRQRFWIPRMVQPI